MNHQPTPAPPDSSGGAPSTGVPPDAFAGVPPAEVLAAAWTAAADRLEEGLLLVGAGCTVLAVGDSTARLLGVVRGEVLGRPVQALLCTDPPLLLESPMDLPRELAIPGPGGQAMGLRVVVMPLPGGRHWALALTDLTAERRSQDQARRRDRMVALGELSAGVAHEIRNPLAGIATSAQVLRKRLDEGDERRRFLDVIQDEVRRLDRIVSGLLDYARPWSLVLKRVALRGVLERAVQLVAEPAREASVQLELRCPEDLPEVFADADQLLQLFLNLLRNAVEAMPAGGEVVVEAALGERPLYVRRSGGRRAGDPVVPEGAAAARQPIVLVQVRDTGEGIPSEAIPRLFDPFFTTRPSGTGLGLAICQTILHEHGGSITAESQPGRGTTFHVELPLEKRNGQRRKHG